MVLTLIGVRMHHEDPSSYLNSGVKYLDICIMANAKWTWGGNIYQPEVPGHLVRRGRPTLPILV